MTFDGTFFSRNAKHIEICVIEASYCLVVQFAIPPIIPMPMVHIVSNPLIGAFSSIKLGFIGRTVIFDNRVR